MVLFYPTSFLTGSSVLRWKSCCVVILQHLRRSELVALAKIYGFTFLSVLFTVLYCTIICILSLKLHLLLIYWCRSVIKVVALHLLTSISLKTIGWQIYVAIRLHIGDILILGRIIGFIEIQKIRISILVSFKLNILRQHILLCRFCRTFRDGLFVDILCLLSIPIWYIRLNVSLL